MSKHVNLARFNRYLTSAWTLSFLSTVAYSTIYLFVFQPGYWINDDLKIIWNLVGYPGGEKANPFLIYSNVILGQLLVPLYAMPLPFNWEILLFVVINSFSVWVFLYLVLSEPHPIHNKLLGIAAILTVMAPLMLNITYTVTAVLASVSGFSLVLTSVRSDRALYKLEASVGIALLFISTLIRIQMPLLVLSFIAPGIFFVFRRLKLRRLLIITIVVGLLVGTSYAYDKLKILTSPDWLAYYSYNEMRQKLHDAHRLNNLGNQIKRVNWSGNDQELFARWFFPDEKIYSFDHIRYLVENTPGTSQSLLAVVDTFTKSLLEPRSIPYFVIMLAIVLWMLSLSVPKPLLLSNLSVWVAVLVVNLFLAWGYKDPDYVLFGTLAGSTVFTMLLPSIFLTGWIPNLAPRANQSHLHRLVRKISTLLFISAAFITLQHSLEASRLNHAKQQAYHQIVADLKELSSEKKIAEDALIISPAHGLPFEWSNPFELERPSPQYFDTGWITFSPSYREVLRRFEINDLPQAMYLQGNLYLMTRSRFTGFLSRYYKEHVSIDVQFLPIYAMPNVNKLPGYDDIFLYKVIASP